MQVLIQQLIIGLSIGSTYALIALGYTMVYGVLRLINFAHGDVYMVGAVAGYYISTWTLGIGLSLWLSLTLTFAGSILTCAILGFLIEYLAYRPLRNRPRLVLLITAIGVSLLLENLAQLPKLFGPTPRTYPDSVKHALSATLNCPFLPAGVTLTQFDLLSLTLSLLLMIYMTYVVMKTRTGLALRAVSHRFDTASLMGVNTGRIISFTFMFGSGLAAVAGVLDGIRYDVRPLMGIMFGLKAFVAAVLGGIGSIPGAVVGGLVLGMTETLVKAYLPSQYTGYADAVAFVILILILLIKPTGLFGRNITEKV
ncbi:MAG TPA: branched-chain amino acid ABC transporter permease [Tepidisphaeraceae bacterium]|jgi:branched-chain amino acid transport system permease protein|nr:branched-chain amino acid ABC transporter permease [Tepidisphaeraceae bacterium]